MPAFALPKAPIGKGTLKPRNTGEAGQVITIAVKTDRHTAIRQYRVGVLRHAADNVTLAGDRIK